MQREIRKTPPHTCFGKEQTIVYHQVASTDVFTQFYVSSYVASVNCHCAIFCQSAVNLRLTFLECSHIILGNLCLILCNRLRSANLSSWNWYLEIIHLLSFLLPEGKHSLKVQNLSFQIFVKFIVLLSFEHVFYLNFIIHFKRWDKFDSLNSVCWW